MHDDEKPTAQWLVCSTLHRYLTEYAIGARSLHSQRLRWVVTDEGNWPRGSDLDLLFLLPEGNQACARGVAPTIKACISAVVASLWDLGFELDHAARSPSECLELASDDAAFLARSG